MEVSNACSAPSARLFSVAKLLEISPTVDNIVVEKFASSPNAAANSFKVSNVPGAEFTRSLTFVST